MSKSHHSLPCELSQVLLSGVSGRLQFREAASSLFVTARHHAHTLLLFTYTDYKTIFVPIAVFAAVAAPLHSAHRFFHGLLWIWIHLLQCNVSNQYKSYIEDAINRPWRPLPSGRISQEDAVILRRCLIPMCIGLSSIHGWDVALTSAGMTATMVFYDEVGLAGNWIGKNLCNISGYLTFEIGATKIMGHSSRLDSTALQSLLFSACVIFTTIQAQDFSDVEGDGKLGRVTFPIYAPSFSRIFTLFSLMTWSVLLSAHWQLGALARILFCCFGSFVGWRYYSLRQPEQDSRSYLIFNIWLLFAHLLPVHARWGILAF